MAAEIDEHARLELGEMCLRESGWPRLHFEECTADWAKFMQERGSKMDRMGKLEVFKKKDPMFWNLGRRLSVTTSTSTTDGTICGLLKRYFLRFAVCPNKGFSTQTNALFSYSLTH
ncbi:MAG: hypothetical protein U0176_23795 [Bacteroidia bacterium]